MKAVAIEQWGDLDHISNLVKENPIMALKVINTGINEKAKILVRKNLGIDLNESILWMQDRFFFDIINAMLLNSIIDKPVAKQIVAYKKMLNYRNTDYPGGDIRKICTNGILVLENL